MESSKKIPIGQLALPPQVGGGGVANKNFIPAGETVTVTVNTQYFIYEDLVIEGVLINNGQVVIMKGAIVLQANGDFQNNGELVLANN